MFNVLQGLRKPLVFAAPASFVEATVAATPIAALMAALDALPVLILVLILVQQF